MATTSAPSLQENKMGTMPIGKLLFSMALPLVLSMLVQAFYNVVDSFYVSRISDSAVTALGLAFPIQNLIIGCSTGVGVGMNALFSKSLGEGNRERANRAAGNGFFLGFCFYLLFLVFGFVGARPYYAVQSSVAETIEGGTAYISICSIFSLGIFVEILGERLLQGSGRTFFTLFTQGSEDIPEDQFRYHGTPPRSKEMVIISLADSCEAAVRSIEKPTMGKIEGMIDEIFKKRFRDNQLVNAEVTCGELKKIRDSFVANLASMSHGRIAYKKEKDNNESDLFMESK